MNNRSEMQDLRRALRLTQEQMAHAIGMPLRTYRALETGSNPVKDYHLKAVRYAAQEWVCQHYGDEGRACLLPIDVLGVARGVTLKYDQEVSQEQ
jgi:DNA-binding XRE family transcriptional regulator